MKPTLVLAVLAAGAVAFAQETVPAAEVGLNYSFTRMNPGGRAPSFTSNGGSGTFTYNLNRSFGLVADLGGYHNGDDSNFNPTTFSYLFGPRYNVVRTSRMTPYVQALFGGVHASTSLFDPISGNSFTQNSVAAAVGGGVDVRVTDHIAVKPFQLEYFVTRLSNLWGPNDAQNNLRYSAGVVFRFGSK